MEAVLALIGSKATLIGGGIVAILIYFATFFRMAFKAGSDSQKAKEGKADAQTIKDIAEANAAASRAASGKLHDDDGFKRKG